MQGFILVNVGSAAKMGGIQLGDSILAAGVSWLCGNDVFCMDLFYRTRRTKPARFAHPPVREAVVHDVSPV
jgi:hypothetical protein